MTAAGRVRLRPAAPQDTETLYRIYASTREEELAAVPWDAAAREAFLRMQFGAQDSFYRATYPDASYDLVVSGEDVLGRLYVHRGESSWLVLDVALLPGHRGAGIGARLLREVLAGAAAAAVPVQIHVQRLNPARHLYHRLGFRQIADQGVYLLLEWKPGTNDPARPPAGPAYPNTAS